MIAIDTNVLVRFLVGDDPEQLERAAALVRRNEIFVGLTVLLETEWVLRSAYGATRDEIVVAFRGVAGLRNVNVEAPAILMDAINALEQGMDFADALHLAGAAHASAAAFATFDEDLRKRAGALGRQVRVTGL
ncbi:MAG TPA: type II toxin-antitoxin system VapC family toxin [Thermomicrobiales bacterium]|nr:type II toxin-antitoxin system VapC family toxin [Thermomicrobiales bacterium]